jgi:hypothetical protein
MNNYDVKQAVRLLRAAKQDITALRQMPDPSVEYDLAKASYHARRAYNALDTLTSCLQMQTVYCAQLKQQIDRLYLVEEQYVGTCQC